jgi:predicted PurR-regulated permease PerM
VDDQAKSLGDPPAAIDPPEPVSPTDQASQKSPPELLSAASTKLLNRAETVGTASHDVLHFPTRSFATTGLFVLACLYTLYFAAEILMPVALAWVLFLILWPVLRLLARLRIPEPVGAGIIVLSLVSIFVMGFYFLSGPAAQWISELPQTINTIQDKFKGPVEELQKAKEKVENAIKDTKDNKQQTPLSVATEVPNDANAPPPEQKKGDQDRSMSIGLLDIITTVVASLGSVGGTLIVIFAMLFFLLAAGDLYYEKMVRVLPTLRDKKRAVTIIRRIHHDVATYLLSVTIINGVLGCAIGLGLYLVGMPNAVLWGVMAAALNFIPYLGAFVGEVIVGIVGLAVFAEPMDALKPVAVYLLINTLEGQFITPSILGRSLTINPLIVFLSVLFWGWLWGIVGALLAVPLLACFKVICDAIDRLRPLSEFLGR